MQKNVKEVLSILKKEYGSSGIALGFHNPLQLLVSTILSAQCTDVRTNMIAKELFKKYKTAGDYANADIRRFESEIRSTGFYHNKAKNIIAMAKILVDKYNGKVPRTMQELIELPGVARKTANIVLTNAYGIAAGVAVDTHVFRVANRLGWSSGRTADKVEQDLMKLIDKGDWGLVNHVLVFHGRNVCNAKKPGCSVCKICRYCKSCKRVKGWV